MAYRIRTQPNRFSTTLLSLLAASLSFACSQTTRSGVPPLQTASDVFTTEAFETPQLEASTPGSITEKSRRVGDKIVHRFSGTFTKSALILEEEVVEVGPETFSVHYTLDEGATTTELVVTRTNRGERIIEVARVESGKTRPATVADYEALVEKTVFVPDQNRGQIAKMDQTCLVGTTEHQCEIAEYQVYVEDREARLAVSRSRQLGRDVSGEVAAIDGTMIYRAELLEVREQRERDAHTEEVAIISPLP